VNVKMWIKALQVIPRITKEEWKRLDIISRWLVSTRSAVLIMTFTCAAIAGLLAYQAGMFNWGRWILVAIGLVFAHATNNLVNDLTDYRKGVDTGNYFRTQYGPQPLEQGLMTLKESLTYIAVTGLIAVAAGIPLVISGGWPVLALLLAGAFFVLFYTFPLKYIGLGEVAVLVVWGPLMTGGGYYAITHVWDWNVVIASLPYGLAATVVLFGKHIDKSIQDAAKGIRTLPVLIGEKASRVSVLVMIALQYLLVIYLVVTGYFTWPILVVLLGLFGLKLALPVFLSEKPGECPPDYPKDVWPLYYVAAAFYQTRIYSLMILLGLILDTVYKVLIIK
jgi:1,4-dihydroxy-2-naphthoate polyprenyltransferase